jgi:hypothetical protein
MKMVIYSMPLLLITLAASAQQESNADNIKQKLIQNNSGKYAQEGGVLNDDLIRQPQKKEDVYGDGFIIHKSHIDLDREIHLLNRQSNQSSDQYHQKKSNSLQEMDRNNDPRRIESREETYRNPSERSNEPKH